MDAILLKTAFSMNQWRAVMSVTNYMRCLRQEIKQRKIMSARIMSIQLHFILRIYACQNYIYVDPRDLAGRKNGCGVRFYTV